MNKLELEFNKQKRKEAIEYEAITIKNDLKEANEIRETFPTYKSTREGGKRHVFCFFHLAREKVECIGFLICPHCGSVELLDIFGQYWLRGFINANKEATNAIKKAKPSEPLNGVGYTQSPFAKDWKKTTTSKLSNKKESYEKAKMDMTKLLADVERD